MAPAPSLHVTPAFALHVPSAFALHVTPAKAGGHRPFPSLGVAVRRANSAGVAALVCSRSVGFKFSRLFLESGMGPRFRGGDMWWSGSGCGRSRETCVRGSPARGGAAVGGKGGLQR